MTKIFCTLAIITLLLATIRFISPGLVSLPVICGFGTGTVVVLMMRDISRKKRGNNGRFVRDDR